MASTEQYRFGEFSLVVPARQLMRGDTEIELQPKVFDTLTYLVRHSDRVISKEELLAEVWAGTVVTDNVLARVISALRKALGDSPRVSRYIRAVLRVGYRFVADVSTLGDSERGRSLAVLPFETLPPIGRDDGLGLGMAETLIARLGTLPHLIARPLSAVRDVAAIESNPLAMARHLKVDAYLEGTAQRSGERIRVTARLLSTRDEAPYWTATFDERFSDVFSLQDSICERIVNGLAPQLKVSGPITPRTNGEAYREYLEGRLFLGRATPADTERARERFEQALDEDPAYAPAWAGIAECHEHFGTMGNDPGGHYRAADRASKRALALRPDLANAMNVQAKIAWQFDWDWDRAERIFEDAIHQHPGSADLHISYSDYCCYLNKEERSVEQAERALVIDPVSPWVNTLLAQAYHMAGDSEAALRQIERTLEFAPDFGFARFFSGVIRLFRGDVEHGLAEVERAVGSGRPDFVGAFGFYLGLYGQTVAANEILAKILAEGDRAPAIARAVVYLGLGQMDEAVAAFEQCIAERDWHVLLLHSDPHLAESGKHPEIQRLLGQLSLP